MPSPKKIVDPEVQAFHRDLLKSVRQMRAGKAGRKTRVVVSPVVSARHGCSLSQAEFAELLGISVRTLQKWEQGERKPSGAAKNLILIAQKHPEVLKDTFGWSKLSGHPTIGKKEKSMNSGSDQIPHIEYISSETTRQAYRYILEHAQSLDNFTSDEDRQGVLRRFNYRLEGRRLYALSINKASLLFYILKDGLKVQPGIKEKLNAREFAFNVPRDAQITVPITSISEAKTLLEILFPTQANRVVYLAEKNK